MQRIANMGVVAVLLAALSACSSAPSTPSNAGYTVHGYSQSTGGASYYADALQGNPTASGERYYHKYLTAAHRTLPFGTRLKVTNRSNGKSVVVKVNDRGPFVKGRIVDLSKSAFGRIANPREGVVSVRIEVLR